MKRFPTHAASDDDLLLADSQLIRGSIVTESKPACYNIITISYINYLQLNLTL